MKHFFIIATFLATVSSASAAEWVLGAGTSSFSTNNAESGSIVSLEVHSDPFFTRNRFSASYMGVITGHSSGDVFVGVGLSGLLDYDNRWFIEGSIAPGYFKESGPANDLGSPFEIRLLLGVGYELNSRDSISLAITHKSNASTAKDNPGVNAVLLRYRRKF